ncbi:hypothetical protein A3F06_01710 [candidate division TM6 bacterium RIFCSPHIGHO2_12_FULL_36_22]|nr:MAG: hypothetical protein A3F06_01710 [candidate division TM6 bacterium RIFCSPHIGHO2_12_FULL_36_22]
MKNRFFNIIKSLFLNGLFTILPIVLTIYLFIFSLRLLASWFEPLRCITPICLKQIPYAEFLIVIAFILIVGVISKFFILKGIIHWLESLVLKIPLVRPVYNGVKQLVNALNHTDKTSFQRVVYVEFPRKGAFAIGFVTGKLPPEIAPSKDEIYYSVFIPTTPAPTTGNFAALTEKDLISCSLTHQEAMTLVISGGIIQPEKFVPNVH